MLAIIYQVWIVDTNETIESSVLWNVHFEEIIVDNNSTGSTNNNSILQSVCIQDPFIHVTELKGVINLSESNGSHNVYMNDGRYFVTLYGFRNKSSTIFGA